MAEKQYYTVEQAAEYLKVHPDTIRRMLRAGTLSGKKTLVNQWRVDTESLYQVAQNYRPEQQVGGS